MRGYQSLFAAAHTIIGGNHNVNDMEAERHERMDAPFEVQRAAHRRTACRTRYAQSAGQGSYRAFALSGSGLFRTVNISKCKIQAEMERIRALTDHQAATNTGRRYGFCTRTTSPTYRLFHYLSPLRRSAPSSRMVSLQTLAVT